MTRGEIKQLARFWLDDENGGYFTDAFMDRVINQAQRELQKELLQAGESYYTICAEFSTVVNQRDYALPSDFFQLDKLELITSGSGDTASTRRLEPIQRTEIDTLNYNLANTSSGEPFNYVLNKNTYSLYPVPDVSKVMRLWYSPRVSDMSSDSDVPDAPADYHEYIAIMAARDGFLRDGRAITPIEMKLRYFKDLMEEQAESRNSDSPRMVIRTSDPYGVI